MLYGIFGLILNAVAGLLAVAFLLRFWMQAIRIRAPNQIGAFIYALTDWLVKPLRRVLPGVGGQDWASLVGALLVALATVAIMLLMASAFSVEAFLIFGFIKLAEWILYGLMVLIIIEVVLSWVNPHAPMAPFINALNQPVLRPIRRVVPLVGGFDLSPLVALVLLQIALFVLRSLTFGSL